MGNQPEKKFVHGAVAATVWQNETTDNNGNTQTFRTVSVQRSYQDKDGNWQNTNTMRFNDLPKLAAVTQEAYRYLGLREDPQQQQGQQQ